MNFLAHAYLSFDHHHLIVGNMTSDFLKGSARYNYPASIQNGIELHRRIDAYTDAHLQIKEAKKFFKKDYRLYSGPIVDILFDHYLANDESIFNEASLKDFTLNIYNVLEDNVTALPHNFIPVLTYMKKENWLFNYRYKSGMEKSLRGLIRRSSFLSESETAYRLFEENYTGLQECYNLFIDDVKQFAKHQINELVT